MNAIARRLSTLSVAVVLGSAVVGAVTGEVAGQDDLAERVKAALQRARVPLVKKLRGAHGGELALLCLAATHDGVPASDKIFAKAMAKLSRSRLGRTYDLALRLMVASECKWYPEARKSAARDKDRMVKAIYGKAGFGYSAKPSNWDLSNTQYAALGLRAAVSLGVKVRGEVWQGMLAAAILSQNANGGFGYRNGGRNPTASMTVAGITIVRLCAAHLDEKTIVAKRVEDRIGDAWEFLAENKDSIGSAKTKNSFYFHYGLERASILCDVEEVDGKDWYEFGAEMLLKRQLKRGGWFSAVDMIQGGKDRDGSDSVSTSFAMLFLNRKFKKAMPAPVTQASTIPLSALSKLSPPKHIATAIDGAVRRGHRALPKVLAAMRSAVLVQRSAAAKALIRITGQDFGFTPSLDEEKRLAAIHRAEIWWMKVGRKKAAAEKKADASPKTVK